MKRLPLFLLLTLNSFALAEERRGDNADAPPSTPEQQLARFKVPPGFEVQLVAAEPQIQKPLNLNFDAAGRLWATGTVLYPWAAQTDVNGQPVPGFEKLYQESANAFAGGKAPAPIREGMDTVRILSDFSPDGQAQKIETFAEGLNIPTGLQPLPRKPGAKGDTALVYSIPSIWRFEDTDGDGKADKKEPLYEGFGFVDTHGMSSNYIQWVDGWIYGCHGFRNHSEVKDRSGKVTIFNSGNTYRFKPDGSAIEYHSHGQTNPFGLAFDPLGNLYTADSHSKPVYMVQRGGYYEGIGKEHDGLGFAPRITDDDHGSSAIAGVACYADDKWPEEFRGNLFNGNPVTQKINRDRLEWHGSTPKAVRMPDFLSCDDPWFRPVQVKLGPDGALYIADFYNPIIGHYEVPLTDPRRDHSHGRIWRVVYRGEKKDAPAAPLPVLAKMDVPALVEKLGDANLTARTMALNELIERFGKEASGELGKTLEAGGSAAQRVNTLWALARLGALPQERLPSLLKDADPAVRVHTIGVAAENFPGGPSKSAAKIAALTDTDFAVRRAGVAALARDPQPGNIEPLLTLSAYIPGDDIQLAYGVRTALRDHLAAPGGLAKASELAARFPNVAPLLAEVALAVPQSGAADYLLTFLEGTKFQAPRAGEYLRHIALQLAPERFPELLAAFDKMQETPLSQRLAIADGLAQATRQRGAKLPEQMTNWMQRIMIKALGSSDMALLDRAIAAVRDAKLPEKAEPLRRIATKVGEPGPRRAAALEALMNLDGGIAAAAAALNDPSSMTLRKKAAELLGNAGTQKAQATPALLGGLANAPGEVAVLIAAALAKSDAGCGELLTLVENGKVSPVLLRNNAVSGQLGQRPPALKDRAASLTRDLPPEDTRLDGVIAQRVESYRAAQPDAARGAQIFQQNCAVCHRFRNAGGNVGPNLDGMAARGPHRLFEDILDPNRNVDPGFRQVVVETNDGKTLAGVNLREQGAVLLLSDATGKEFSLPKADVKTRTPSKLSLMPPIFEALPQNDLQDLVAFLLSTAP